MLKQPKPSLFERRPIPLSGAEGAAARKASRAEHDWGPKARMAQGLPGFSSRARAAGLRVSCMFPLPPGF